jgi:preprotein translocase subunit SecE
VILAFPTTLDQVRDVTTTSATTQRRRRVGPLQWVARRIGRIGLFFRQVIAELRKVVRPTRTELITYTTAVLIFVLAVMLYVSLLDVGFGYLVLWAFGG